MVVPILSSVSPIGGTVIREVVVARDGDNAFEVAACGHALEVLVVSNEGDRAVCKAFGLDDSRVGEICARSADSESAGTDTELAARDVAAVHADVDACSRLHTDVGAVNNQAVACGDSLRERNAFNRAESDCPVSDTFAVLFFSVFREGDVSTCSGRALAERIAILPDVVHAIGNVCLGNSIGIGLDVVELLFLDFFSAIKISPCPLSKKFSNEFASRS